MKRLCLLFIAVLLTMGLSACGLSITRQAHDYQGQEPAPGKINIATVGSTIYSNGNYTVFDGAYLLNDFRDDYATEYVQVHRTMPLHAYDVSGLRQYCASDFGYFERIGDKKYKPCFVDSDNDGRFDKLNLEFAGAHYPWVTIGDPVPYKKTQLIQDTGKGFKLELIYQGMNGNTVMIKYREYRDSFVRPAYVQDIYYTLPARGVAKVAFKGLRMQIIDADNSRITYMIVRGL